MANLSPELVTQRVEKAGVSIQASVADDAAGEVMWASTTTFPDTVVVDDAVDASGTATDQTDRAAVGERVDEA